jgi:hypothetical protein
MSLSNDYAASQLRNLQIPTFPRSSAFSLRSANFSGIFYYLLIQERIPKLDAGFVFVAGLVPLHQKLFVVRICSTVVPPVSYLACRSARWKCPYSVWSVKENDTRSLSLN